VLQIANRFAGSVRSGPRGLTEAFFLREDDASVNR